MEILIKTGQLLLSLSILIVLHELGHFAFAKLFKARVEKFYLFFDPWFSLFKFKKGETEYGIGWLPLGGYVKISGMIDESMDKEQLKEPPQPYEFRSKPAWQRLLIMVGGVLVNFLLAIAIYIMVLFVWGEEYLPVRNASYGVVCDSTAMSMGLRDGDKLLEVDGQPVDDFSDFKRKVLLDETQTIRVEREGRTVDIAVDQSDVAAIIRSESYFVNPAFPFVVDEFAEESPARAAGLSPGDQIVGIDGDTLLYFAAISKALENRAGQEVTLAVLRDGQPMDIKVKLTEQGKLGVYARAPAQFLEMEQLEYSLGEAIPAGVGKGYTEVKDYLKQLKLLFQPETEAYKSVGGFIAIGSIFPDTWDWYVFWKMTALLSIMLAVVNILPIPALDGGHVLFLLFEMVSGRKPSDKFLEYAQLTGMVILLTLLIYANGNDIVKLFD